MDSPNKEQVMRRLSAVLSIVVGSTVAFLLAAASSQPATAIKVSAAEAATISGGGGNCGQFAQIVQGACTNSGDDSCTTGNSNCSGACSYDCGAENTFSGSGSFTGALITGTCDSVVQPTCTQSVCSGVLCCLCVGGNNIICGPAPNDLDTQGCSS
jgi:hypothetical protein